MLFLFFFFTVSLLIYGLFLARAEKRSRFQKRMDFFFSEETIESDVENDISTSPSFSARLIKPMINHFQKSFKRKMPGEKEEKLERKLLMAGNPFGMTPVDFRLVQIVLICLLPLLFGGYGYLLKAGNVVIFIFIFIGGFIGLIGPYLYLKQKTKARGRLALKEFPDILDLLTVSLEAGLGFDAAVSKVVSKKEGIIAREFHRCLEEIRLGKTRREALSGIKERVDIDEIKAFISNVLQAEKLGIGMVQVLRVQSSEVREQRKQRAEEAAMKAPIKMLFPLVIFIFPSLFIVLLGPAILQFIETFKHV